MPQREQVMQADQAARQAKRVQVPFAEPGEGDEALRRRIAIVEGIGDDPSAPWAASVSGNRA